MATRAEVARYGAFPVVALASTLMLEQGERLSLAQAFDGIKADFGVSDTALGFLAAAMVIVGVVGGIPIGVLADRWRRTTLLVIAMVIWTACMGLGAIAPGFVFLLITRLGIGAVEANGPAAFSLMADYYPVGLRARMLGRYQLGGAAGGLVGIGLSGVLVDQFGWRSAFWMWIPFGLLVVFVMTRLPEPERGVQDFAYHVEATTDLDVGATVTRTSSIDYGLAKWPDVIRELLRIRSMWFAVMALTISGFLLNALGAWGVEFFKRAHDLSATEASAFVPAIGGGAAIGLVGGGALADRLLQRGVVNARVYVTAFSSVVAAILLVPAFLSGSLAASAVLLFFGSLALTTPVAPTEALLSDVVPGELRGRAASVRAVVRALSALSPFIVGVISDASDLQTALAVVTPLYGVGGLVMLLAAKTYPADLAFVAAEARRTLSLPGSVPDTSVRK